MADPIGHSRDNSIDSVLSEDSQTSRGGTPRRAHPALFPKVTTTSEGTIRAAKLVSPTSRTNSGLSSAFDDIPDVSQDSPLAATGSRKNSRRPQSTSPTPSTPSNISSGKGSKGRSSTASRRARMKSRKSITGTGVSEEESSASEGEGASERMFEDAFAKYDLKNEDQIPMSEFLHFFDSLQSQLPPLSEPLLRPDVRQQMLTLMSQVMSQSDDTIYVSKEETKGFYKAIAGKDIEQELSERRHGNFPKGSEISSFRGRLQAAQLEETPRRPSNISPERRTPFGGSFARPMRPSRQQSMNSGSMGDYIDEGGSDLVSAGDPSQELTSDFLASSTPAKRTAGHGYFSPPVTSPTHSQLSFGADFPGGRGGMGSPGFNTSAHLESDLAAAHRELRQKQLDFIEKEQELADLRHKVDRNREEFEEEISSLTDESNRLRGELEQKRKEIVEINKEKDELRAEAAVYLDQVSDAKREIEEFSHQHDVDRENILALSQDNQRYAQQASDALRRVDALTADLQTVMRQKEEVEIQKASYQKKADLMTKMHKQIKDLQEDQKDREFEIERLKSELHSRQMDLEIMMAGGNPSFGGAGSKGRVRDSVGPGTMGLLSDELEDADGSEVGSEDEDEDEEEEVVTTTKTIKRRKKAAQKGPVEAEDSFEVVERVVDTTDRGVQAEEPKPKMHEMATDMDDLPVPLYSTEAQTDLTVDVGTSLQEHFEALLPPPSLPQIEFSMDEEGFKKLAEYEKLVQDAALTRQQLEEFSNLINVQAGVIERFVNLGEANAKHKVRKVIVEKHIPSEDPIAYLNYATHWLQNWLRISIKRTFKKSAKGDRDEWAEFLEYNPEPSFAASALLLLLFISIAVMTLVAGVYFYKIQSHEAMWRKLNTLQGYPRHAGTSGGLFGGRTWRVLKHDVQRMIYGQVRFPV